MAYPIGVIHKMTRAEYNARYYQTNRERMDLMNWKWRMKNGKRSRAISIKSIHKQRAAKYSAEVDSNITAEALYIRHDGICGICQCLVAMSEASIDHIVPFSKGGNHTWDNVQLAHKRCNSQKSRKAPWES
jgi:5-methylcytosine-specific restriction endonuclease McrA